MRHDMAGWLNLSSRLIYSSVPLDRTAAGGRRAEIVGDADPGRPGEPATAGASSPSCRVPAGSPAASRGTTGAWCSTATSPPTIPRSGCSTSPAASAPRVLPPPGSNDKAAHFAGAWKRDNSGFFFVSDRSGEFRELMFHSLADGRITPITRHIKGDIEGSSLSADGKLLAVRAKVEGRTQLVFFDAVAFNELPSPALPEGSVTAVRFHPRLPVARLRPEQQQGTEPDRHAGARRRRLAGAGPGRTRRRGSTRRASREQQIVRWKSFDGREITGIADLAAAALRRPATGADRHPRRPRGRGRVRLPRPQQLLTSRSSASP